MAKSAAERKAEQRARQAESGNRKLELQLDGQEMEMLARNCAARRPGRAPYDMNEYIVLLIRQTMRECAGELSQSALTAAESAAMLFRLIHVRAMVIRHAG